MRSYSEQIKSTGNPNGHPSTVTTIEKLQTTDDVVDGAVVLSRVIWFIAGVIDVILAIRFILILFGANTANVFDNFMYTISYPFAVPFFGLFNYNLRYGVSRVELSALFGILIYSLVALGITRLITINRRDRA